MNHERFPWKFSKNRATVGKQISQRDILQMVSRSKEITPVPEAWKCTSFTKMPPAKHKNVWNRAAPYIKGELLVHSWKYLPLQPKPVSDSINNLFPLRHEKESSTAFSEKVLHVYMCPHRNFEKPFSFSLTYSVNSKQTRSLLYPKIKWFVWPIQDLFLFPDSQKMTHK